MAKLPNKSDEPIGPVEIFVPYSHKDASLLSELRDALSPLGREGTTICWDDRKIDPGEEWGDKINQHLNSADIILPLISAGFIASDYCYTIELQRAMQRQEAHEAEVVPIIVKKCDWQHLPFAELQVLPDEAKPVTLWEDRDSAWTSVAEGVRKVVESVKKKPRPSPVAATVLAPAARVAAVRIWNVPHNRNRNFVGRETVLSGLHDALANAGTAALTQALTGLGGVGKTQTATEYAYRYSADYDVVWWIRSEEPAKLAADYAALAKSFGIAEERELNLTVQAVKAQLAKRERWLLVFDNANKVDEVHDYLPQTGQGHVLITSRDPNWSEVAEPLRITTWPRDESVKFLLKRTKQSDEAAANGLAEALGDLPLALEQASAYIEASGSLIAAYLRTLREHTREILRNKQAPVGYHATVATTWELAFAEIEKTSEAAAQLMNLCAFLAPDDIRRDMLLPGAKHLPEPLKKTVEDDHEWIDAVSVLRRYSLVEVQNGALSVHRLVQVVARERMEDTQRKKWAEAAIRVVNGGFPQESYDVRTWPVCARLLPHAQVAAGRAEELGTTGKTTGRLLNQVGLYLWGRAELTDARVCFERSSKVDEAAYGPEHPHVATSVGNLGGVLRDMGDLEGARACYESALKIDEATYGPEHPNVARDVNNLGDVLRGLKNFEGARACVERALRIAEGAYGPEHPNVATCVNNLGGLVRELGDLKGAQACFERALRIDEAVYGPGHPEVATDMNNLGSVLRDLGDIAGSQAYFDRALSIFERSLGKDHPKTKLVRENMG